MALNKLIDSYPSLAKLFHLLDEKHSAQILFSQNILEIPVALIEDKIKIHESQLLKLANKEKPDNISSFKYFPSYGIKFKNYFELCISIQSDDYRTFEGNDWKTKPLRFKINTTQFEIGPISPLMTLLTVPIWEQKDIPQNFTDFATLKMVIKNNEDYKHVFSKAIFYLNSYYLKPISFYAALKNLVLDEQDSLTLYDSNSPSSKFDIAKRTRNIQRKDFVKCEPLYLYNFASTTQGEQQFLSYYRVLEFFLEQAFIKQTEVLRFDKSISNEALIKALSIRKEVEQLKVLFNEVLSKSKKTNLINYAIYKELITDNRLDKVAINLYKFRNAVVHAKESETTNTNFPDPFEPNNKLKSWIYITDELAKACIMKFNTKKPIHLHKD